MHLVYIGLGSNLESPLDQVSTALAELAELSGCKLVARSSIYRSAPVGPVGQPDYINAVAALEASLSPIALLRALQSLEQKHDRVRLERWGPRTLDLDILLYDDLVLASKELTIPHIEMCNRNFVLIPLFEIAPDLRMPDNRALSEIVSQCSQEGLERIAECR